MSKSIGNVVNPVEVMEKYGRDALVYYVLSDMSIGSD
jgi:methionyl-tRNA synthetase